MGNQLTIITETVREYAPSYGAYSRVQARQSPIIEAVQARKAYEHVERAEPRQLDMRA